MLIGTLLTILLSGGYFTGEISAYLEAWGYRRVEIPTLMPLKTFKSCTEGTENRMFEIDKTTVLAPEVTNYIRSMGFNRLGSKKVYYVARCFRNESNTNSARLREFTQVGVELLGDNSLDCRKIVRRDAVRLFEKLLPPFYTVAFLVRSF